MKAVIVEAITDLKKKECKCMNLIEVESLKKIFK